MRSTVREPAALTGERLMPVIVFASPKGGAGKSTSAVVLATELALKGATRHSN